MIEVKITGETSNDLFRGAAALFYALASDNNTTMQAYLKEISEKDIKSGTGAGTITVEGLPQSAPMPETAPAPAPVQGSTQQAIPTAAPTYSMEDLSRACMSLTNRQDALNLLNQFGVSAITELPKAQYGAFATALRQLGAQI